MRVNSNVGALNTLRQLNRNQAMFDKSLEKLSSGFRINSAGDDPAGLVLSEQLRAQITGIKQALRNTQDASSMIQTAEGAMSEMHSLLNQMRSLVLHAKNTGVADTTAIAADQAQIDQAVAALDRIAKNTTFGGKNQLNGSSTNQVDIVNTTAIASVVGGTGATAGTNLVNVAITTAATRAIVAGTADRSAALGANANVTVNGLTVSLTAGQTQAQIVSTLNSAFTDNNLDLTAVVNGTAIDIRHNQYGSAYSVKLVDASNALITAASDVTNATGVDVAGSINSEVATGSGLTLKANAGTAYEGTSVTFTTTGNAVATLTGALSVTKNNITFQVGETTSDTVNTTIGNLRAFMLGTANGGLLGLNSVKTGATYNLTSNPTSALAIIDEAINQVSTERAKLGSVQKYTLDAKINSLSVAQENVTASESRLRDADMAMEMAGFTKNQILVQSATAMLAQANASPQSVLSLLGR